MGHSNILLILFFLFLNLYKDKIKTTPYLKTEKVFPDLIKCLDIKYIEPNKVDLSKSSLKEVSHEV